MLGPQSFHFSNTIRSGLMLGPQNAHGRTFVKMQNLFDAGAGAE